jgi:hypothetical protein
MTITPKDVAKGYLLEVLKPGDTVYTVLKHVSSSGMSRRIDVLVVTKDGGIRNITHLVAPVTGFKRSKVDGALTVSGCGMDMGFHVVYSLSRALFEDGVKCTGKRGCPSNDHSNDYGRLTREYEAAREEEGTTLSPTATQEERNDYVAARQEWIAAQKVYYKSRKHDDGGYSLHQHWI